MQCWQQLSLYAARKKVPGMWGLVLQLGQCWVPARCMLEFSAWMSCTVGCWALRESYESATPTPAQNLLPSCLAGRRHQGV